VADRSAPQAVRVEVPFVELGAVHDRLKETILSDVASLIERGDFVNGSAVVELERAFADYCGSAYCVGVSSGLDALRLALLSAGIKPGDEVVVPAQTFPATLEAVTQAGGTPVVADVSESDYNLDPVAAEAAVGPRTRFLLPTHLYGQLADVSGLRRLADRYALQIVEDACQAHGAKRDGIGAGTCGLAAAFSFYPTKNLGALGDAGALVTDDDALTEHARALREHGQYRKNEHAREGYTARLDTIQALVLLRKLPLLDAWNDERRRAARFYTEALEGVGDLRLPPVPAGSVPVWHLYVVRTARPDRLATFLNGRRIGTGRHYPQPPHLAPAYARLGYRRGSFPVAERLSSEAVSLPIYPGLSEARLTAVVEAIRDYFSGG
jgi:dTDP-3-amino-3,4,6-trideoxy-alpha-D-glucose transaminase